MPKLGKKSTVAKQKIRNSGGAFKPAAEIKADAQIRSDVQCILFQMVQRVEESFHTDAENRLIIEEKLFEIVEEVAQESGEDLNCFDLQIDTKCDVEDNEILESNDLGRLKYLCQECDARVASFSKNWKERGANFSRSGTSRSTYFRAKRDRDALEKDAGDCAQPLSNFFSVVHDVPPEEEDDDDFVEEDLYRELYEDDLLHSTESTRQTAVNKYTVKQAIQSLSDTDARGFSLSGNSKDVEFEKSHKFFDRLVAKAIKSYLFLLDQKVPKMIASRQVAAHIFSEHEAMAENKDTYKAQCIRDWSKDYLFNGKLPEFRQGQHSKTETIIRICTFNFADLKENIDKLLQPCTIVNKTVDDVEILMQPGGIAIDRIRNFARFCYRFMDGYRKGLSGPILDYTLKKCKTHRSIPDSIIQKVMGPDGDFAKFEERKQKRQRRGI